MSAISQKKEAQKAGPEIIFNYIGATCLITAIIEVLLFLIFKWSVSTAFMASLIYFLILAGIFLSFSSYLKSTNYSLHNYRNWIAGLILLGLIGGLIFGVYNW